MAEFERRFDEAKRVPVPDLREDIEDRARGGAGPPNDGDRDGRMQARHRLAAGVVALVVFVAAGAFVWQAFGGQGLTPVPGSTSSGLGDVSDVLLVRCDPDTIDVSTPVVAAQADGLHVVAHVTGLAEGEVSISSDEEPWVVTWSGSDGVGDEFVRPVPLGDATVHCESGPGQGDGPERLSASFTVVDPGHVVVDYRLECAEWTEIDHDFVRETQRPPPEMSPEEEVEAFWHVRSITDELRGLLPGDVIEPAGYVEAEFPRPVSRLVRDGNVIGSFDVHLAGVQGGPETWQTVDPDDLGAGVLIPMVYEIRARVCGDTGVGFVQR